MLYIIIECVSRLATLIVFAVLTLGFAVAFVVTLVIFCCKKVSIVVRGIPNP